MTVKIAFSGGVQGALLFLLGAVAGICGYRLATQAQARAAAAAWLEKINTP